MALIMPNGSRTVTRPMGGGRTNRFDGSGWASDGTRIPAGGQAQPQQSPYATSTPYGQKPQSNPYQQWNQGGTNQQQTRTPSLTDYMAPGSPFPGRNSPPRSTDYPTRSPQQSGGSPRITPSISFAPGTSEEYKQQVYDNWNATGRLGPPRPADYGVDHRRLPGGGIADPGYQRPGQAQPQQSPYAGSSPYGQGGGQQPNPGPYPPQRNPAGRDDPAYREWRYNQTTDMRFRRPAEQEAFEQRMYDQWLRTQGGRPGPVQQPSPAQPPMQGPPQQPMIPPGGVGNWGNQTYGRPDPFYMDGADPFGGWGGMDQFLGQRAAFVNNINQHRGRTASQGLPPAPMDFNQMWNQAGQMYQQGWQNPLQGLFG